MPNASAPHIIIVLAHLMDPEGRLNAETAKRVTRGCQAFREFDATHILFMGWPYRDDSEIAICDAMNTYQQDHCGIPSDFVLVNANSRDTVGDAVFSRHQIDAMYRSYRVTVVTSEYHTARTSLIFNFVFGQSNPVVVLGVDVPVMPETAQKEAASIKAFQQTFAGVGAGDLPTITRRLLDAHPFYNGTAFPDSPVDATALTGKGLAQPGCR